MRENMQANFKKWRKK